MKFNRSVLAVALTSAALTSVQAAEQNEGFIAGSSLDAKLRTYYFNRDFKANKADAEAASQALRLDFESGYAGGIVGFDASLFTVGKLAGDKDESGTGLLAGEQDGYTKFGQAYAKFRLGENVELKAGRMVLDKPLFNDSDSRSTPSSTQAVLVEGNFDGLELYAIYSDRASSKTDEDFEDYTDTNGDDYEVVVIGGGYTFDSGLGLHLSYGEADNVLRQTYLNASYPIQISDDMKLSLDGHYYMGEADGDGALASVGSDYDSDLLNLAARLHYQNAIVTLSYQQVDGDEYEETWGGSDDNGLNTWNSVQRLDFDRADEQSWQVRLDYAFESVEGLTFMTRYTHGDNIDRGDGTEGSEWERNIELKYAFQNIDGLSVRWRNSTVRSTETNGSDENRLILNYTVGVF